MTSLYFGEWGDTRFNPRLPAPSRAHSSLHWQLFLPSFSPSFCPTCRLRSYLTRSRKPSLIYQVSFSYTRGTSLEDPFSSHVYTWGLSDQSPLPPVDYMLHEDRVALLCLSPQPQLLEQSERPAPSAWGGVKGQTAVRKTVPGCRQDTDLGEAGPWLSREGMGQNN